MHGYSSPSQTSDITDSRSSAQSSKGNLNYILPTPADRKVYSRADLLALRPCKYGQETQELFMQLKTNCIFRYRGPRRYRGCNSAKRKPIPTLIKGKFGHARENYSINYNAENSRSKTVNFVVLRSLPKHKDPKSYDIPTILSANVRSLTKKVDEVQQIAELKSAGVICITESWLSSNIPNSSISIPGYNVFRKDRTATCGGGVCLYLDQRIPCKHLISCEQDDVEPLWISMRPHSLPRQITSIVLAVIYHSTSKRELENVILQEHIQRNLDMLLSSQPNALVIITGDFNPTTTGLKAKDITQRNHLKQLVTFKTRDSETLDWFITNRPKLFTMSQLPKIASYIPS